MLSVFDIILLGILLVSGLLGLWRGLAVEVMSLLSWAAAFWVALAFGDDVTLWLAPWIETAAVRAATAYVGSFILTLVFGGALTWTLSRLIERTGLSGTDRLLGFLFGLTRGFAVCVVAVLLLSYTPMQSGQAWADSSLIEVVQPGADWLRSWLPTQFADPLPAGPLVGAGNGATSSL